MNDGTERWEYAWISPQDIPQRGNAGWHLPYASCWNESISVWWEGKMLMERQRIE